MARSPSPMGYATRTTRQKERQLLKKKQFDPKEWKFLRLAKFKRSLRYAAAAKAYRLAKEVTLEEVAKEYGYCHSAVCTWESGKYFGWTSEELKDYLATIDRIANV